MITDDDLTPIGEAEIPEPFCDSCNGTGDSKPGESCMSPDNPPCPVCGGTGGKPSSKDEARRVYEDWQDLTSRYGAKKR